MKIKETLLKILAVITSVAAAVFYVLFQQKKEEVYELEEIKEEAAKAETIAAAEIKAEQKVNEVKKENEILEQTAAKPNLSGLNAMYDLMRK